MRILHVIESLEHSQGGPPAIAYRLAAAQCFAGASASIVHQLGKQSDLAKLRESAVPSGEAVAIVHATDLDNEVRSASVVQIHGVWNPFLTRAAVTACRMNVPYVVLPHGMLNPWSLRRKRIKKTIARVLWTDRMLRRAAAMQVATLAEREYVARFCGRVVVLPNGIFPSELDSHEQQTRPIADSYILFLGRVHTDKGVEILATSFAEISRRQPGTHLVVAGPDHGAWRRVQQIVKKNGTATKVHRIDAVHGRAKAALLRNATVFALPSAQEGFSVAVVEALAAGVPVVITPECHFDEVARVGAGILAARSSNEFAAALESIVANADRRAIMGEIGRRFARENFDWARLGAENVRQLQGIIDAR